MEKFKIGPGEHYVTQRTDLTIITVLGSCVAACIRDPLAGVGGMNHFMLPEGDTGTWGGASSNLRYGNYAMEALINDILRQGGQRRRLEVKVFGGASMIMGGATVGDQNAEFVEAYLKAEGMPIVAHHLRGINARRVEYDPGDGRVRMLEMSLERAHVVRSEQIFFAAIRQHFVSGTVELYV